MRPDEIESGAREKLESELADVYESGPITDPTRFSGRVKLLDSSRSQLAKPGMSFAIYGVRGLGKSSFVNVLLAGRKFIRRTAQRDMAFPSLFGPILKALNEGLVITQSTISNKDVVSYGAKGPVVQAGGELSTEFVNAFQPIVAQTVDYDYVATALIKHSSLLDAVVIEEFHRLSTEAQKEVVDLMKTLCNEKAHTHLFIIGTTDINEQLINDREYKDYIGRCITAVPMPQMTTDELRDIIDKRAQIGIEVDDDVADDLVWVASGYPALVHTVMYDAAARWIVENVAELVASVIDFVSKIVAFFSPGAGKNTAIKRVELDKAGVRVGREELRAALQRHITGFESAELGGSSYEVACVDREVKAVFDAYALADSDELGAEAATALFPKGDEVPAGLRSYLRAKLLLAGETRAKASASAQRP
jgi:hypothetical protein